MALGKILFLTPQIAFATLSDHPHYLLLDAPVDSLMKVLLKNYWQYKWVQYFCSNTVIKKLAAILPVTLILKHHQQSVRASISALHHFLSTLQH